MSSETSTEANPINGLETGKSDKAIATRESESVFLKRRKRRRLDLRTLHGTAREHAKVYRGLAEGTITQMEAEVRSRVLGRHREILGSLEQRALLEGLQEQLAAIHGESTG